MRIKNLLTDMVVFSALLTAFVHPASAGTDAAAFLNNGIGARAMGMGGAYVSLSDDPTAMYWNPAGIGQIKRISFTAMGQSIGSGKWDTIKDIAPSYQFVGITFPVRSFSIPGINNNCNTFGIGVVNSSLGSIPYTTVDGNGVIVRDTLDNTENAYFLSYGIPLMEDDDRLCAGVTFRYITQQFSKIADASATGYDLGAGVLYNYGTANIGLSLERGADIKWANGHSDTSPMTTRLGVSNKFHLSNTLFLTGAMDIVQRQSQPVSANIGAELGYERIVGSRTFGIDGLYLRTGIDGYTIENRYDYLGKLNNQINLNAGIGIGLSFLGYSLQLDYVFGSYRLGDKSRFSLNLFI